MEASVIFRNFEGVRIKELKSTEVVTFLSQWMKQRDCFMQLRNALFEKQTTSGIFWDLFSFFVECYRFGTVEQVASYRIPLIQFIPAFLELYFYQDEHFREVETGILCIYNSEAAFRNQLSNEKKSERIIVTLLEAKEVTSKVRKDYSSLSYFQDIKQDNQDIVFNIVLQTFNVHVHQLLKEDLLEMSRVLLRMASSGLPYEIPKCDEVKGVPITSQHSQQQLPSTSNISGGSVPFYTMTSIVGPIGTGNLTNNNGVFSSATELQKLKGIKLKSKIITEGKRVMILLSGLLNEIINVLAAIMQLLPTEDTVHEAVYAIFLGSYFGLQETPLLNVSSLLQFSSIY